MKKTTLIMMALLLPLYAHAQQVIQQQFYTAAPEHVSSSKLFWLQIGQAKPALIQLKRSDANFPRINPTTGESNFDYVNPRNDNTFSVLPKGLFHWRGDQREIIRAQSASPNNWADFEKNKEYVSGERTWVEGSYKPHPFDQNYMVKITARLPEPESKKAAAVIETITVGTFNVLGQKAYTDHAAGPQQMTVENRRKLFAHIVGEAQPDVLALQEFFPQDTFAVAATPTYKPALICGKDIAKTKDTPDTCLLYNSSRLAPVHGATHYVSFKQAGGTSDTFGATMAIFETVDAAKNRIAVASVHLQGGPGPEKNYAGFRIKQLTTLTTELTQFLIRHRAPYVVIAGDFNTNGKQHDMLELVHKQLSAYQDAEQASGAARPTATLALKKSVGAGAPPSTVAQESLDYIFYTPALRLEKMHYVPESTDTLISHGVYDDSQRTWPSDHKLLRASFKLPSRATPVAGGVAASAAAGAGPGCPGRQ